MAEISKQHNGASVIAVAPVPADQVYRYGIIAGECISSPSDNAEGEGAIWKVTGLVEKPRPEDAPSHLFIVGRYLLSPKIMDFKKIALSFVVAFSVCSLSAQAQSQCSKKWDRAP